LTSSLRHLVAVWLMMGTDGLGVASAYLAAKLVSGLSAGMTPVLGPALDRGLDSVYTQAVKPTRAKLFPNGGSQAVRLPKECRFVAQREVLVRREGRRVILEPVDEWSPEFRSCLGSWSGEVPRPKQQKLGDLRNPFG